MITDTHADEFSHAVQIGNAITEKKMLDVILQARDWGLGGEGRGEEKFRIQNSEFRRLPGPGPLFHAITDCGAGGLSSAIREMGEKAGAAVDHTRCR